MKKTLLFWIFIFFLGCVPQTQPKNGEISEIVVVLSSKGNDVAFDQKALQVPFGKKVKFIFKNKADGDSEIDHNIAIIKPGKEEQVLKILNDEEYEFDDETDPFIKNKDLLIAYTRMLPPQREATLEFTPEKKGYYTYICLMPGHGNILKMKGILKVK